MNAELLCLLSEKCCVTTRGKSHNGVARPIILLCKMRHHLKRGGANRSSGSEDDEAPRFSHAIPE